MGNMLEIGSGNKFVNCQISDGRLILNGEEIPKPPAKMNNTTMTNGKVFVDGYEYKDGKWKRTIRAWFHKYF